MNKKIKVGNQFVFTQTERVNLNVYEDNGTHYIDIKTNCVVVRSRRAVVSAAMTHILDPFGTSARWGVEITSIDFFGDTGKNKTMRISYRVNIDGGSNGGNAVSIVDLTFSGTLFEGTHQNSQFVDEETPLNDDESVEIAD